MAFKELATRRFSVRKYTNEPVSKEDIEYIMDCVRLSPSACNRQPWKFLLLTSDNAKEKIRQCYNRDWFKSAPVYVLCFKDVNGCWVRPEDGKPHGDIDLGIAVEHLCLAAADRGLGSCWVCNYDVEAVKRLFPDEEHSNNRMCGFSHGSNIMQGAGQCPVAETVHRQSGDADAGFAKPTLDT